MTVKDKLGQEYSNNNEGRMCNYISSVELPLNDESDCHA